MRITPEATPNYYKIQGELRKVTSSVRVFWFRAAASWLLFSPRFSHVSKSSRGVATLISVCIPNRLRGFQAV